MKKSLITYEEIVRLVLFLITLIFIFTLLKTLIIPIIFEKNKVSYCKMAISLKNSDNRIKEIIGNFGVSSACNDIENKEVIVESKEDVLYYLLLYTKKTCDIFKSGDFLMESEKICPFSITFLPKKSISISSLEISKLTSAIVPVLNKPLYEYCQNPAIDSKDLILNAGLKKKIKICYIKEKDQNPKIIID